VRLERLFDDGGIGVIASRVHHGGREISGLGRCWAGFDCSALAIKEPPCSLNRGELTLGENS
jgi:hypothetical protein